MKSKLNLSTAMVGIFVSLAASSVSAQGFPTIDATAIANDIQQLRQLQEQYATQLEELSVAEDVLAQAEEQLLSMTGASDLSQIADDLASISDIDPSATMDGMVASIMSGSSSGPNAASIAETLEVYGVDGLGELSVSEEPLERGTAQFAGVSAASVAEGEAGHEASQTLASRASALADGVGSHETLKEAVDYNSLILAEIAGNQARLLTVLSASLINDGTANMLDARSSLNSSSAFRVRNSPTLGEE